MGPKDAFFQRREEKGHRLAAPYFVKTVGRDFPSGCPKAKAPRSLQGPSSRPISSSLPARGLLEDKNFHDAVNQSLVDQVPYFCQFRNKESARFTAQNTLYLLPTLPLPSSGLEARKGEEQEKDMQGLGKQESGKDTGEKKEGELKGLREEESEEEEELSEEEEGEEEAAEEKGGKRTWPGTKSASKHWPSSPQSQPWQWQQDLKVEEQQQDEKEATGR